MFSKELHNLKKLLRLFREMTYRKVTIKDNKNKIYIRAKQPRRAEEEISLG